MLPLAIYEAERDRGKVWLHTAIIGTLSASAIASASRAGACLVTVELLVLPWLGRRPGFAAPVITLSLAFAGMATMIVGPEVLWARFHDKDPLRYLRAIAPSTVKMIPHPPPL